MVNVQAAAHFKTGTVRHAYWAAAVLAAVVGLSVVLYFSGWRYADMPVAAPSFRAGCVGRFLLAAAALAYVIRWRDLRRTSEAVGSGLAAVAVMALLLSAVLHHFESGHAGLSVNVYGDAFYDVLVGFLALAIITYLAMERWYQDRSVGVWVIPIAAVVVTILEFELVRMMPAGAGAVLRGYWHCTTVLLSVVGYVLLGVGCALGLLSLLRASHGIRLRHPLTARVVEHWMVCANTSGVVLLLIAAALWEGWAAAVPRLQWFVSPLEPWVFATALLYGGHLVLQRTLRPALVQTAFWAVGLYLSSLVAFIGINVGVA